MKWWGVGIAVACHATALAAYLIAPNFDSLPLRFTAQFIALVGSSALASCVIALSSTTIVRAVLMLAKIVFAMVVTFPLASGNAIPLLLGIAIVVELSFEYRRPLNLLVTAFFIVLFTIVRLISLDWVVDFALLDSVELVVFPFLALGFIAVLTDLARRYRIMLAEQSDHIERLDSAVQQLSEANLGFQRYADFVAERSTADERNRITREVHDTTVYALTNLKMMVEAASYAHSVTLLASERGAHGNTPG